MWLFTPQPARNEGIHQVFVVDLKCWPAVLQYCLTESTCNYFQRIIVSYVPFICRRKLLIPRVHSLPRQGPWCFSIGPEQTWTNCCASGKSPLICVCNSVSVVALIVCYVVVVVVFVVVNVM